MIEQTQATGGGPWPFPRIRLATPDDIPALMDMCRRIHEEIGLGRMSESLVLAEVVNAVARKHAILGVIGPPGKIEGSICLKLEHYWYSDNHWWLADRWLYVDPKHRSSSNAKELLAFAKWWASELQIPLMMMFLSNDRTEGKRRLFERELGSPTGHFYLCGDRTGRKE